MPCALCTSCEEVPNLDDLSLSQGGCKVDQCKGYITPRAPILELPKNTLIFIVGKIHNILLVCSHNLREFVKLTSS